MLLIILQRERAWQIFPFPCIGSMRFLDLSLSTMPSYNKILSGLTNEDDPKTLLDVGCCFGQDLRKLILDGAPMSQIRGLDLRLEFIDLGHDLFKDQAAFDGRVILGDIFDDTPDSDVTTLHGKADFIHIAAFLHLFGWEGQIKAAVRLTAFLKDKPGTMILGRQLGSPEPGEYQHPAGANGVVCSHDEKTFRELWDEVEKRTGTRWRLEMNLKLREGTSPAATDMLHFECTRIG